MTSATAAAPSFPVFLRAALARRALVVALIALGYALSLYANLPGHFEPDSLWQLAQGRADRYNTWHPPVMAWLLGRADSLAPGAWPYVAGQEALFFGALAALAALSPRPTVIGGVAVALVIASPLVFVYQGVVWKDVLFADASVAGFAVLPFIARAGPRKALRAVLIMTSVALFTLASLVRQNGSIVAALGITALGAILYVEAKRAGAEAFTARLHAVRLAIGVGLAVAVVGGTVSWALYNKSDKEPETANLIKALQVYDLSGEARLDPVLPLPLLYPDDRPLEQFIRDEAVPAYSPVSIDTLEGLPQADEFLYPEGPRVGWQWRQVIVTKPLLYLRTRLRVFRWIFLTPDIRQCAPIFTGIDPDHADLLREAGLRPRYDARDTWLAHYSERFLGTPVFSHLAYALVGLLLLVALIRDLRRGGAPELIALVALLLAAYLFAASFFVIGIAADYRYLYFLDAAVIAALVHRLCAWRGLRTRPSSSAS